MTSTLVLDQGWMPVRVVSTQVAFCDWIAGKNELIIPASSEDGTPQTLTYEEWCELYDRDGRCDVVARSKDKTIKSISETFPRPMVVRLLRKFKRNRMAIRFSRINVFTRDDFRCLYCGEQFDTEDLTYDHVVPRSQGGTTCWTNIVTSCREDNHRKADRTPQEAGMKLLRMPSKPTWLPVTTVNMDRRNIPEEWRDYWTVSVA